MKILNTFTFFLSFLYLNVVIADVISCDNKSSYEKSLKSPGGSLVNFPVQDQGNIGSCYANALTVALYPSLGFEVSPNFLAIQAHKNDKGTEITDGGDPCSLFEEIKKYLYAQQIKSS